MPDFVSATFPARSTDEDKVREIAHQLHLRVTTLPEELRHSKQSRGRVIFGSGRDHLLQIAANYDGWEFEIADGQLRTLQHGSNLSAFDELAGGLMSQARRKNGRLAAGEYQQITAKIDRAGFRPGDHLEKHDRNLLRLWNRANSQNAIQTFSEALRHTKKLWALSFSKDDDELIPNRAVLRRLARALDKYKRAHPELRKNA